MSIILTLLEIRFKVDYSLHDRWMINETKEEEIMVNIEHIKKSEAYHNPFFVHCREWQITRSQLAEMAPNWELVTRKFWLSTCSLAGALAGYSRTPPNLLLAILKIAAEDGGIGGGAVDDRIGPPHYELYRQMWTEGGVDWSKKVEPETEALVSRFPCGYGCMKSTLETALANVVIVETVASNIIEAMMEAHKGARFDTEKLAYLQLHQHLELEHAAAMPAIETLAEEYRLSLWPHVQEGCKAWGRFWQAMDRIVFGG